MRFSFRMIRGQFFLLLSLISVFGTAKNADPKLSVSLGQETCWLKSAADAYANSDSYATSGTNAVNYAADAGNLRHWDKRVVQVFVNPDCSEIRRRNVLPLLTRGMAMWSRRMNNTVHLVLTDNADAADVSVTFVSPGSLSGKSIGRTDVTFRMADQVLVSAKVSINENLSEEQLVQVTAHEMGHALGVQGHSPSRADLMYPYAHLPARITVRDQNTMNLSYGLPCIKTADADSLDSSSSALHSHAH